MDSEPGRLAEGKLVTQKIDAALQRPLSRSAADKLGSLFPIGCCVEVGRGALDAVLSIVGSMKGEQAIRWGLLLTTVDAK